MINRCKYCGSICPDFSDMCDTCAFLEDQQEFQEELEEELEKEDA